MPAPLERTWYYASGDLRADLLLPDGADPGHHPAVVQRQPYFTFTREMLTLDPDGYSLRWYRDFSAPQLDALDPQLSFVIASRPPSLATTLGTLAALGLSRSEMPFRALIMGILISPMIVPLIISAAGMFFFYSKIGLAQTYLGRHPRPCRARHALRRHHRDRDAGRLRPVSLTRAAASLGASPTTTFFKVTMPLILPGVISGALFAFITSFDEIVVVLFLAGVEQRTIPREMWSGIREPSARPSSPSPPS
jgi:putative spermidine/putrescine transport system permease protein